MIANRTKVQIARDREQIRVPDLEFELIEILYGPFLSQAAHRTRLFALRSALALYEARARSVAPSDRYGDLAMQAAIRRFERILDAARHSNQAGEDALQIADTAIRQVQS